LGTTARSLAGRIPAAPAEGTGDPKAKKKSRGLSTLHVTPGTVFMGEVDCALLGWADARTKGGRHPPARHHHRPLGARARSHAYFDGLRA